jgi:hypothetical protein
VKPNLGERLESIISHPIDQVLKEPDLLVEMLRIYSLLYLEKKPCSTCTRLHRAYYIRLRKTGKETILNLSKMKTNTCKLKEGVIVLFKGVHYSHLNITDKVARDMIKWNPVLSKRFETLPADEAKKKAPTVKSVKAKITRLHKKREIIEMALTEAETALEESSDNLSEEDRKVLTDALNEAEAKYKEISTKLDVATEELNAIK